MSFVVKGPGAVILLFRLEYKTSVVCHNVFTQKLNVARRDRPHILVSNRCETFENLHIDIAPHCQKLGTRWRLRVRTKATMAANSYKKMYGEKETFSNISIMNSRVFGARLETC